MEKNIELQSDGSVAGILKLIGDIEKGLEKYGTTHRLILDGELYLTDIELSERLKISRRTLQDYRSAGKIPFYMVCGRVLYRQSDIEALLQEGYNGTADETIL
ncbi:helix-turn-helix domain-containing protein [Alistipes indistinctus]|uniref:helix-turn-helix domain-containing protein n=1 Tax=Alistipes indistinctus TaxID=626932 RepID=UPI0015F22656|nr:helix-turn-helix domain-containing protein [Alistipes indistinctus]BCG54273.1 transcriptional regulator [Alistipes indistinctus]